MIFAYNRNLNTEELLIDADGHILEPPDLWERYLEPKYRDRALRIRVGDDGREFLEIDGKRAVLTSPTLEPPAWGVHQCFDNLEWADWYLDPFAAQGVPQAFATLFQYGVFDRFPRLRVVVLESGAGWIGYWLNRADAIYRRTALGSTVQLKERPSFYFKRQCYISADPDERSIAAMTRLVGEARFFWASDYPHPDHPGDYLAELRGMVEDMTTTGRRGVLGENVARAYKLLEQ